MSWDDYGRQAEKGPASAFWLVMLFVGGLMVLGLALNVFGFFTGAANDAVAVAKKEFYPEALLRKYEWFKDAHAQLEKKRADVKVYETRLSQLKAAYPGESRSRWSREDREQHNIWSSEVSGVKASYNTLAAEYNAQMSKFNWRFTNKGDLPPGAENPLPREVAPYVTE